MKKMLDEKAIEEKEQQFWEEKTAYTPESRIAVHEHMQEKRKREEKKNEAPPKKERMLFTADGKPMNANEAKIDFTLSESEDGKSILLDVAIFRHMDTSLCDVDVQPTYVRVLIKGKVLQLVLNEEVNVDSSTAQRSQITGHLLITMPKVKPTLCAAKPRVDKKKTANKENDPRHKSLDGPQLLEVDPSAARTVDLGGIVQEKVAKAPLGISYNKVIAERPNSEDFVDDPDVPPLE